MNPFRNDHHLPCYHGGVATPLPLYGIPSILGSPIPYFYLQNDNGIYLIPSISLGCFGGTHVGTRTLLSSQVIFYLLYLI